MNKQTFMSELARQLRAKQLPDTDSILEEYEEHFKFKIADGFCEEEITARLGDPRELAQQYIQPQKGEDPGAGARAILAFGLAFVDIIACAFFVLLFAWVAVIGAFSVASAALGFCLIFGLNPSGLIPSMPYGAAALMGISLFALALLAGIGTFYCWKYTVWLAKLFSHWQRRIWAAGAGKATPPSLVRPLDLSPKRGRRLRLLTAVSLIAFGAGFVLAYIILTLKAGALEFWHVWHWFE